MRPTLLILAAGMGSRYGGLKQIDGIGPNQEPIIEYSIYDAIKSGFGKIVFVIRKEFDEAFRSRFDKFSDKILIKYVYQEVNVKVDGLTIIDREKPWGTSHAVLVAKDVINEPFAVINADDFYGAGSFNLISNFLVNDCSPSLMCMIGYTLNNTLSEYGTVNRGVCEVDEDNNLVEVIERTKIAKKDGIVRYNVGVNESSGILDENASVSMNYWGFHPEIFKEIEKGLNQFMRVNSENPTAEYYIPNIVTEMIMGKKMSVRVIPTNDNWFGVTYKDDKPMAVATINKYITEGIYPKNLWI
ncbi:MAG: nucleotidyltransferase [Flavobacteriales bacterium]|nr:nucleotidyltransferase [Flavobacteriales bacterium]|tara:strand:+ start:27671 stop:28570 length:900 start_codon:yes stop_codon:yes gene_type:complete